LFLASCQVTNLQRQVRAALAQSDLAKASALSEQLAALEENLGLIS